MDLNRFRGKKILILGFAKEGRDNFLFLRKIFPKKVIGIADKNRKLKSEIQKLKLVKEYLGKEYLKAIKEYDVVIKSPGVSIHLPEVEEAYQEGKITSQTEIFLANCPGTVIGVTGTKGKSTTANLIYKILKEGKFKVCLIGNIGKPVLNLLFSAKKNDFFVYEMSSHQLYNLGKSPHIAVFLNLYPEHLDYYKNFKEYVKAKSNITLHQKEEDYLIFNSKNKIIREIAKKSKAKKIPLDSVKLEKVIRAKEIPLIGNFNLQNVKAAVLVGKILGISDKIIAKAVKSFKPLHHRLEFVGKFKGIKFYNDALSTIPQATIGALDALGTKKIDTIILGGYDRGIDFSKLAEKIVKTDIKNLVFFPTSGEKIWQEIKKRKGIRQSFNIFFTNSMKDAVKFCFDNTKKEKICLLSCASPSFSIFKDYKEKGNLFKKYIRYFGEK